jgi:phospholipid transport system substrate-binding protein
MSVWKRAMISHRIRPVGRRNLLGLAATAFVVSIPFRLASTQAAGDAPTTAAVEQLDNALLAAMKAGGSTPFDDRYRALAPVVERVFDLDAVLADSIGLSWATLPAEQRAALAAAFRRYTISSYATSFNSYNGQSFQVSPTLRALGNGQVVVNSSLLRVDGSSLALDYVMRRGPTGWQAVDVLTDGSISRVAVQRSDFRGLLSSGGTPALLVGLEHKVANLLGGTEG